MENKEEIVGHIRNTTQGFWGTNYFSLFFTTQRLIIAKTASVGTMLWRGSILAAKHMHDKTKQLGELTPENILSSDPKNYAIPYTEIIKISMKKPESFSTGKIILETRNGVQKFNVANKGLMYREDDFDFVQRLSSILGDRMKME